MKRILFSLLLTSIVGVVQASVLDMRGSLNSGPGHEGGNSKSYSSKVSEEHSGYKKQGTATKQVALEILEFSFSENTYGERPFGYGQAQTVFGLENLDRNMGQHRTNEYSFAIYESDSDGGRKDVDIVGESTHAAPVSEPKTWVIMLSGLVFLAYSARRRDEIY